MNNARRFLNNEKGVALPIAMLALIILSALVIGFSVLASTEPTIANNQLMVAQARAVAEAGVEQAIWALNRGKNCDSSDAMAIPNGPASSACAFPASWTAPAPYDASQLVGVSTGGNNSGGFRVRVTKGASNGELVIASVGWVPNDTATNPKAHQKVVVTIFNPRLLLNDPPAALSVRGELQAGGNAIVDSRADTSCGAKAGTITTGVTCGTAGDCSNFGAADIYGADGNTTKNQIYDANNGDLPSTTSDIIENVATTLPDGTPVFDKYIWTDADIDALRAYAKAYNGRGATYLQGTVAFNSSNKIPEGLVFVDTVSGNDITQEGVTPPTPPSDFASVGIQGNAGSGDNGVFSGVLFVNGTLSIDGAFKAQGLVYAQNDIVYHGIGTGGVWGAMMSRNIRDQSSTSIDSDLNGQSLINYNCAYAKTGGGKVKDQWGIEAGTYKELSGS